MGGEMALIAAQCGILTFLYWGLATEPLSVAPRALGCIGTVICSAVMYMGLFPMQFLPVLGMIPTVLGVCSRVPQIKMNHEQGHTGTQSMISWGMACAGNLVRTLTTLATFGLGDMI